MNDNHPYGGGFDDDPFVKLQFEDELLYNFADLYCRLFEKLTADESLEKFELLFEIAGATKKRIAYRVDNPKVHCRITLETNRATVFIYINDLAKTIYLNRFLAEHQDAHALRRYLPQHLTNDEWLMEKITGYTPPREKRNTFAVKIMHQRNVDGGDDRGQHIIFLPIPDGLAASEAAADWKLLQKVCREMR